MMEGSDILEEEAAVMDIPIVPEDMAEGLSAVRYYRVMHIIGCVLGSVFLICAGFILGQMFSYAAWHIHLILSLFL